MNNLLSNKALKIELAQTCGYLHLPCGLYSHGGKHPRVTTTIKCYQNSFPTLNSIPMTDSISGICYSFPFLLVSPYYKLSFTA